MEKETLQLQILPEHPILVMSACQPKHWPFKLVLSVSHGAPYTSPKVHPSWCRVIGLEHRRSKERKNKKFIHYKNIINSRNQLENNLYKTCNSNYYTIQPFQDHLSTKYTQIQQQWHKTTLQDGQHPHSHSTRKINLQHGENFTQES